MAAEHPSATADRLIDELIRENPKTKRGAQPDKDLTRALMALATSAYRTIPLKGCRLVTIGNACVTALGMMAGDEAVGALGILKAHVKPIPVRQQNRQGARRRGDAGRGPRE
jgi:hypothetical protein